MAEPLNQNEIDSLLGAADAIDDGDMGDMGLDPAEEPARSTGAKHVGIPEAKPYRFKFYYSTPIVKNSDYVFNPNSERDVDESVTVVRTLKNYAHFLQNKKK